VVARSPRYPGIRVAHADLEAPVSDRHHKGGRLSVWTTTLVTYSLVRRVALSASSDSSHRCKRPATKSRAKRGVSKPAAKRTLATLHMRTEAALWSPSAARFHPVLRQVMHMK
jgi:hypothetical protein